MRPVVLIVRRALLAALLALTSCMPPAWGASALLHPTRRPAPPAPAEPHEDLAFTGDGGVPLRGWRFAAAAPARGVTVVWLHGIGDTRASAAWLARELTPAGFDVLAWDARAHGESGGAACTYGYLERRDVSRALDAAGVKRAILVGHSLGAAVALQAAAEDPRVVGVVAVSAFSDLATIARDRAPWFASDAEIREAFRIAEREAGLVVAETSPILSAPRIHAAVLLVHGALDRDTLPEHSRRILAALAGPKELRLLPGVGHNEAFGAAWPGIRSWLEALAPAGALTAPSRTP
ncbi:MAG: alpha/beta fold hydrolase [Anaeromyxobacteraceae bacterium]